MFKRVMVVAAFLLVFIGCSASLYAATQYQAVDLGVLPGDTGSYGYGINDANQIIGWSTTSNPVPMRHPFIWANGVMTDLNVLDGASAMAHNINDAGKMVGFSDLLQQADGSYLWERPFLWQNGVESSLRTLGFDRVAPYGINDEGKVVGWINGDAATWSGRTVTFLSSPDGWRSIAYRINNRGDISGDIYTDSGDNHAVIWRNGVLTDIGETLGGYSETEDISDAGLTVGTYACDYSWQRAYLWQNGALTPLGDIGGTNTVPMCINDVGQIVGPATDSDGVTHGFVWQNGVMTALPPYTVAEGINNYGWIVGYRWDTPDGSVHATLWKPKASPVSRRSGSK